MTSRQAKIQQETNFRFMRSLQKPPDLTQRELGDKLGMCVEGLYYCLNILIDKSLVKMQNFQNSKNKFKYVYLLTVIGVAEKLALTGQFLSCKKQIYQELKAEIDSVKNEVQRAPLCKPQQI
jgi:EPS-associated MarR family transcriptional regulator